MPSLWKFCWDKVKNIVSIDENLKKKLLDHFLLDTSRDSAVHPKQICLKCASKLKNIIKRGSTPSVIVFNFNDNISRCCVCTPLHKRKSLPLKSPNSATKVEIVWDKKMSLDLLEKSFPQFNIVYPDGVLTDHLPPKMLNCSHCLLMIKRPITVTPCEHSFCVHCFLQLVEGKSMSDLACPICKTKIDTVFPSKKLMELIDTLKVLCKECKTRFNIKEEHRCVGNHQSSSLTLLTDLMDINTEDEITKEINDAVVHVIKKKIDGSQLPNKSIVLQTGGR